MNETEYMKEIEDIAAEARREARAHNREVEEVVCEAVDSHAWVIYTQRSIEVLLHSSNADMAWEDGFAGGADSFSDTMRIAAYCAMRADVMAAVSDLDEDEEDRSSWVCTDCARFVANGDLPDEETEWSPELLGETRWVIGELREEFSSCDCDACGSTLAGERVQAFDMSDEGDA